MFQVLSIDNNPSVALADSKQITVTLTFDDPTEDLDIREHFGVVGLRQHRIQRVCNEAYQQGGLLTVEDLVPTCRDSTVVREPSAVTCKT